MPGGIALPQVYGLDQCGWSQRADILISRATTVEYTLRNAKGELLDSISFEVDGDMANASDIYDRSWTGTREGARIMAKGLLASGYRLKRETVRHARDDFPPSEGAA